MAILAGTANVLRPLHCLAQDAPSAASADVAALDPNQQLTILTAASSSQDQRDEAARRLVFRRTTRSKEIILQTLREPNNPLSQLAIVRAIGRSDNPEAEWIDPLFTILKNGSGDELIRASADALASYHQRPDVLTRLTELATRRTDDFTGRASVGALASFLVKPAADTLINLLNREDLPVRMRGAVIDALSSMTGLTGSERDTQRWNDWWQENRNKSDADFRLDLLQSRARRYDEMSRELTTMDRAAEGLIREQYRSAVEDKLREELLVSYLQSPAGSIRRVGALLASQDASEGRRVPDAAVTALISQVGDSDYRVRLESVNALQRLNDPRALDALTAQLSVEDRSDVRAAIVRSLATVADIRVAPQIIALLDDRSPIVVKAAADALTSLGKQLRENNPDLATVAAAKLKQIFTQTAGKPGMQEVRESALEAMVPLRRPEMLDQFIASLRKDESTRIRRAAVNGIAEVGNEKDADTIAPYLDDSDKAVQLDAVKAIGKLGASEFSNKLVSLMTGSSDESIRKQAWEAIAGFTAQDKLKVNQLQRYADELKSDPKKRLVLLSAVRARQIADKQMDELIITQINIGECLEQDSQFDQAAASYQQALQNLTGQPSPSQGTLEKLLESRTRTLLRANKYDDAIQFAGEWIRKDQAYQQTFGPLIRKEVERLSAEAESTKNNAPLDRAMELIKDSRNAEPPLARQYQDQLKDLELDITKRIANRSEAPNNTTGATANTEPNH